MKRFLVTLTMTEPLLGTVPKDVEIYKSFVQAKAAEVAKKAGIELTEAQLAQEVETATSPEAIEDKGWTGFHHKDGRPLIYDYWLKGFLKEACGNLRRVKGTHSSKLTAYRKILDGLVFVEPRQIFLEIPEGEALGILERPLRAQTMQGERVTLARSDCAPVGTQINFTIVVLGVVEEKHLVEWLDYGRWKGLGQWRNGGYGRFEHTLQPLG